VFIATFWHFGRASSKRCLPQRFKKKNRDEIPLPNKKANEIKELLLMIYPNVTGKQWARITHENCYYLAKLAHEYQIDAIV